MVLPACDGYTNVDVSGRTGLLNPKPVRRKDVTGGGASDEPGSTSCRRRVGHITKDVGSKLRERVARK